MKAKHLFVLWAAVHCCLLNADGQTWQQLTNYPAICAAMSADGCKLAACASTAHAMISSTNAGQTWHTNQTPSQSSEPGIYNLASSADGTKLVARYTYTGQVYLSTNSGSNWMATTVPANSVAVGVCSSALGNILAAAAGDGLIYVSTNSGLAWASNAPPGKTWAAIACSADGTKLAAAAHSDQIYVSTNFGATWTATQSPTDNWSSLACSADGTRFIASGTITCISTNFGANWTTLVNAHTGYVASSADGTKLIIAGGGVYTSGNSGATWVTNSTLNGWFSVASSADGSEWLGCNPSSGVWMGRTTPSPQLNLQPAASNLTLSWLVPSTNFVVQQNSSLTTTNWVTLTNVPAFQATTLSNQMTLPLPKTNQGFFRLVTQ